jgi:hypothetical protein
MKRICVFCGSGPGSRPEYCAAAQEMAAELVQRNIGLVYGGGNVGLMGELADAMLRAGGEVQGVIPENLMALEVGYKGHTKLHVVRSMHERKALMADLSDAFVALPRRIRDAGGVLRSCDMDATRFACEALRNSECAGVLHRVAGDVRPRGGGTVPEAGEPGIGAGEGPACRSTASTERLASDAH